MKRTPMTRKTPLAARTPMARGTSSLARTPMKRAPARTDDPRAARTRKTPARTGPTATVRQAVIERDDGRCVRCGAPGSNVHHRSGRGMGGAHGERSDRINRASWLVVVCGSGNTSGCHGWAEANRDRQPERDGYVIRRSSDEDATAVPVRTTRGWVLLDDDGGWARTSAPEGAAA